MKSFVTTLSLALFPAGLIAAFALALLSPSFHAGAEFIAGWVGAIAIYTLAALALLGRSRAMAAERRRPVRAISVVPPTRRRPLAGRIQSPLRQRDRLAA